MNTERKGGTLNPVGRRRRPWVGFALLSLALCAAGCGGNLTAGGFSEVEAYVAGDDPGPEPVGAGRSAGAQSGPASVAQTPDASGIAAPSPGVATPAPGDLVHSTTPVEGTLTVSLRLELQDEGGRWVEITEDAGTLTVSLSGTARTLLAIREVPAGRFVRSRVTFQGVEADILRGLVLDGLDLRGRVSVDFGGAPSLVLEDALFLDLREGASGRVVVAMNSQLWLRLANVALRRVPEGAFRQAVRVRVGR